MGYTDSENWPTTINVGSTGSSIATINDWGCMRVFTDTLTRSDYIVNSGSHLWDLCRRWSNFHSLSLSRRLTPRDTRGTTRARGRHDGHCSWYRQNVVIGQKPQTKWAAKNRISMVWDVSFYQWSLVSLVRPILNPHVFDTICLGAPPAGLASGFLLMIREPPTFTLSLVQMYSHPSTVATMASKWTDPFEAAKLPRTLRGSLQAKRIISLVLGSTNFGEAMTLLGSKQWDQHEPRCVVSAWALNVPTNGHLQPPNSSFP